MGKKNSERREFSSGSTEQCGIDVSYTRMCVYIFLFFISVGVYCDLKKNIYIRCVLYMRTEYKRTRGYKEPLKYVVVDEGREKKRNTSSHRIPIILHRRANRY